MSGRYLALVIMIVFVASPAWSRELVVEMHRLTPQGTGGSIGTVVAESSPYGVLFIPDLQGLPEGPRGFHVHEHGSCDPGGENGKTGPGLAAGGHFDPLGTDRHAGPYDDEGHLGDLPVLIVEDGGTATIPVAAPRLRLFDLYGRSLIIHEGGDNYSDEPPLGGGAGRIACGVFKDAP